MTREQQLTQQLFGPVTEPKPASNLGLISVEVWLAKRLGDRALFDGITTDDERRERIRQRILDSGIADEIAGNRGGRPETFRSLFRRLYEVEL